MGHPEPCVLEGSSIERRSQLKETRELKEQFDRARHLQAWARVVDSSIGSFVFTRASRPSGSTEGHATRHAAETRKPQLSLTPVSSLKPSGSQLSTPGFAQTKSCPKTVSGTCPSELPEPMKSSTPRSLPMLTQTDADSPTSPAVLLRSPKSRFRSPGGRSPSEAWPSCRSSTTSGRRDPRTFIELKPSPLTHRSRACPMDDSQAPGRRLCTVNTCLSSFARLCFPTSES